MSAGSEYRISFHIENAARAASDIKKVGDAVEQLRKKSENKDRVDQDLFNQLMEQLISALDKFAPTTEVSKKN